MTTHYLANFFPSFSSPSILYSFLPSFLPASPSRCRFLSAVCSYPSSSRPFPAGGHISGCVRPSAEPSLLSKIDGRRRRSVAVPGACVPSPTAAATRRWSKRRWLEPGVDVDGTDGADGADAELQPQVRETAAIWEDREVGRKGRRK